MAHEVTPWKMDNCAIAVAVRTISKRETFSREINRIEGEGGALNANYRTVDAVAQVCAVLGHSGLEYGTDFVFKMERSGEISFDFKDPATKERAIHSIAALLLETQETALHA